MRAVDCTEILKALADPTRQRILKALLAADLNVSALTERLQTSQYNTSKHLRVLKDAGIVKARVAGKEREYSIPSAIRRKLQHESALDFGCCTFRLERFSSSR